MRHGRDGSIQQVAWLRLRAPDVQAPLTVLGRGGFADPDPEAPRVDLVDTDLRTAYLGGADLRRARLFSADLRGAYLHEVDLQGAALNGANLQEAHLPGAKLQDADLQGTKLDGVDLRGVLLDGAAGQPDGRASQAGSQKFCP